MRARPLEVQSRAHRCIEHGIPALDGAIIAVVLVVGCRCRGVTVVLCVLAFAACGKNDPSRSTCLLSASITGEMQPRYSHVLGTGSMGAVAVAPNGHLVVTGTVEGPVKVPGQTVSDPPSEHPFIMELDPDGGMVWYRSFTATFVPWRISVDADGHIVLAAALPKGGADLGPGTILGPVLIAKLDPNGQPLFTWGIEAVSGPTIAGVSVQGLALAVDASGDIAVAGKLGTTAAQPGAFVAHYGPTGALRRARVAGDGVVPRTVAFDGAGGVVVAGELDGTLDWPTPALTATGGAFALALGASDVVTWAQTLGDRVVPRALVVNGGRGFLAATFAGTLTLDEGRVPALGGSDIAIVALDAVASPEVKTRLHARYAAGRGDALEAIVPDGDGGLVAALKVSHPIDLGRGLVTSSAALLLRIDPDGRTIEHAVFPATNPALTALALARDAEGTYLFGGFSGEIELGNGPLQAPATGTGLFVAGFARVTTESGGGLVCDPPPGALDVYVGRPVPRRIVLTADVALIATVTEVISTPLAGGPPELLAIAQKQVEDLAVAGEVAYWTNAGNPVAAPDPRRTADGSVVAMPRAGGPIRVLADGLDRPGRMAVDRDTIYVAVGGERQDGTNVALTAALLAIPTAGGVPVQLASGFSWIGSVAARDGRVVFAAGRSRVSGEILQIAGGGPATSLAFTDSPIASLALDDDWVYWAEDPKLFENRLDPSGSIWRAPLDGGTKTRLASDQTNPHDVVILEGQVYWANAGPAIDRGGVWRTGSIGGRLRNVVRGSNTFVYAIDPDHLVWLDASSGEWLLRAR
jgi:hypothetical protein